MKPKSLKQLSRAELLELLLEQTQQTERLQAELDKTQALLDDRNLKIREAGNLADAVMCLNGVMEAAQAAADQYLDNIKHLQAQTEAQCQQILEDARQEADRILEDARHRASQTPEAHQN